MWKIELPTTSPTGSNPASRDQQELVDAQVGGVETLPVLLQPLAARTRGSPPATSGRSRSSGSQPDRGLDAGPAGSRRGADRGAGSVHGDHPAAALSVAPAPRRSTGRPSRPDASRGGRGSASTTPAELLAVHRVRQLDPDRADCRGRPRPGRADGRAPSRARSWKAAAELASSWFSAVVRGPMHARVRGGEANTTALRGHQPHRLVAGATQPPVVLDRHVGEHRSRRAGRVREPDRRAGHHVLDRALAEVVVAAAEMHADDGVGADLERLLGQAVERPAACQVPGVGQRRRARRRRRRATGSCEPATATASV